MCIVVKVIKRFLIGPDQFSNNCINIYGFFFKQNFYLSCFLLALHLNWRLDTFLSIYLWMLIVNDATIVDIYN